MIGSERSSLRGKTWGKQANYCHGDWQSEIHFYEKLDLWSSQGLGSLFSGCMGESGGILVIKNGAVVAEVPLPTVFASVDLLDYCMIGSNY